MSSFILAEQNTNRSKIHERRDEGKKEEKKKKLPSRGAGFVTLVARHIALISDG